MCASMAEVKKKKNTRPRRREPNNTTADETESIKSVSVRFAAVYVCVCLFIVSVH